jgi:glycosyltransferase involved in cell wall biosynthesis
MEDPAERPSVSVVIETITAREHDGHGPLADELAGTIAAAAAEGQGHDRFEILVVVDDGNRAEHESLARRFPGVRLVTGAPNYFAAKNAGVRAANGEIVVLLDADCRPQPGWLAALEHALASGADVVAGRTRYEGPTAAARTFSVPDFGNVLGTGGGASGLNLNNAAYRRATFLAEPLDPRIRRNGGCYLQFHALRRRGARIVYAADALVEHGLDVGGLGFVHKHFARGFDGMAVYRLDDRHVLRGSAWVQRLGPLALVPLQARRVTLDWGRLLRHRRQMDVGVVALPYYAAVCLVTRTIELAGGVAAWMFPRALRPDPAGPRP